MQELGFLHSGEALEPDKTYSNGELSLYAVKDMSELSEVRDMLAEEPETLTDVIRIMGETL